MKSYKQFILECKKRQEINESIGSGVRFVTNPSVQRVIGGAISKAGKFLQKVKIERMMNQPTKVFDQSSKGWRSLPNVRNQEATIRLYSKRNPDYVNSTTRWHLGQTQALQGKNLQAITNMNASKNSRDPQWNRYVNATTSFLKKDPEAFANATNPRFKNYNQSTIDRLGQNFNKSYENAY